MYALELYEAMRASEQFEPIFLAKGGPPVSSVPRPHEGTLLGKVNDDSNQYFFYTDDADFDWFYGTSRNKDIYIKFFREFLVSCQPDIVHFQHTLFFGYDIIRETRNTLPNAPIVYTLHEFVPICHRNGQMVRTNNNELCPESSPSRCHECFPDISRQAFFMRKRFIQSHLSSVDVFLAPSRFLLERYVQWGIPRAKIRHEDIGRRAVRSVAIEGERSRNRFGFFGQFSMYKGVNVLLKAMKILREDGFGPGSRMRSAAASAPVSGVGGEPDPGEGDVHLWLHGANLELQPGTFQNEFRALLEATADDVTLVGGYGRAELPALMANVDWVVVPSIWWENSPLVIQEAFLHGRPVICSDIGGMAEKVAHGVNGLHFRAGNAASLAQTIRRAASSPELWEALRRAIPEVYRIDHHVRTLTELYRTLLDRAASPTG